MLMSFREEPRQSEEYEKKTVKSNGEGACVIEKQEINIVINFTLDGKDFRI